MPAAANIIENERHNSSINSSESPTQQKRSQVRQKMNISLDMGNRNNLSSMGNGSGSKGRASQQSIPQVVYTKSGSGNIMD